MKRLASLRSIDLTQTARAVPERAHYRLSVPRDQRARLAKGWLALGMGALVASGVFSLLLVAARTPGVSAWLPGTDFFRTALVVHVDLSVLVWFTAFACMYWTLAANRTGLAWSWSALVLCAAGALGMSVAAFVPRVMPIMANYIPVLDHWLFHASLLLFALGAAIMVWHALAHVRLTAERLDGAGALRLGLIGAAASVAVALIAFWWSWLGLPAVLDARTYYELLFWGGGHVLQFTWTLLLLVSWLWLAEAVGARLPFTPRVVLLLFALALALVLATPFIYLAHEVTSVEHRRLLTWMMRVGGGFAILPMLLGLAFALRPSQAGRAPADARRVALIMSLTLFAAGGLIGFLIRGSDVKIPAHYHGCIVGITLAFMGVAYDLLPRFGFAAPTGAWAHAQPAIYGIGQLMHITGLVWSGGYGVQRKVAGSEQLLHNFQQIAGMSLMGLGGLIAIIGGMLFIVVVTRSVLSARGGRHA